MKVPCGGFDLDESVFNVDKNAKQVKLNSPISYDYMPEGYPKKSIEAVTLMEEREVTFADVGKGVYGATAPVKIDVLDGQTYTVVWDGVEYSCVGHVTRGGSYIGNPAAFGAESTGEPFVYANRGQSIWGSYDTATSHTIKVMRQQETITPMSTDFIPKNLNVVFTGIKQIEDQQVPTSCNVTYDELRRFADNDMPIFAIYKYDSYKGIPMCIIINGYDLKSAPLEGNTDMVFYYETNRAFVYNSDGTFSALSSS